MARGMLEPQDPFDLRLIPSGQGPGHKVDVPSEFSVPLGFRFSTGFIQEELFASFCASIDARVKSDQKVDSAGNR